MKRFIKFALFYMKRRFFFFLSKLKNILNTQLRWLRKKKNEETKQIMLA